MAKQQTKATTSRQRPATNEGAYVMTGICGRLGKLLARRLHRVGPVIGIDRRPFPDRPKDVVHVPHPLHRKKVRDVFRREPIRAVIHLGVMHDPRETAATHHTWNVEGFAKLLEYCAAYDVPKLILMSSASLYGGRPENPQYLTEEAPLMAGSRSGQVSDQIQVDMLAQSFFWRRPECETVVLRPVSIVGQVNNAPTKFLRAPRVPVLAGFDPLIQLIHELDLIDAVVAALRPSIRGVFNLAGPTAAPLSALLRQLGRQTYRLPFFLARPLLRRAFSLKLTDFPAEEVDYIQYQCLVDGLRARAVLDWEPTRSLGQILAELRSCEQPRS